MRHLAILLAGAAVLASAPAAAQVRAEAQALDLLKRGIGYRTVAGPANQTPAYADYLKSALVAGGFDAADVETVRVDDTAYLIARYRGSGAPGAKPILVSGHMDVVEAKPEDWTRDPFTPVVENGYVFGRGASDNKFDVSAFVATLIELKRQGFRPARDIVLLLSGDEETAMKTTAALAQRFADAALLLNIDAGGGELDTAGKPVMFGVQAAEKTYADFELSFTDAGGHSSAPRAENPIYRLAAALQRIAAHRFPGEVNEITRAAWRAAADATSDARVAAAMRRFAANPDDAEALAVLRADPALVGQTGTTCVATMVNGGHAANALPQRATATVNCRIFPGTTIEAVQATLAKVAGEPAMQIRAIDSGTVASPASPLAPQLMQAVTAAIRARFPAVAVVPVMSAGATDSMWFRAAGVPSYGVSPLFMKASDGFAHGLNERVPVGEIGPAIRFYRMLLTRLAG